ncbi:MAG: hypothetical protein U0989_15290 [Azonexus sp.]|nr:hypothetical protein [Azonexus sp.]
MTKANQTAPLSLLEAAQSVATSNLSTHDLEVLFAHAIEHGELRANVKRLATEQWEGQQLPGNINRLETFIERSDLKAWLTARK